MKHPLTVDDVLELLFHRGQWVQVIERISFVHEGGELMVSIPYRSVI